MFFLCCLCNCVQPSLASLLENVYSAVDYFGKNTETTLPIVENIDLINLPLLSNILLELSKFIIIYICSFESNIESVRFKLKMNVPVFIEIEVEEQAEELRAYFKSLGAEIAVERSDKGFEDDLHKIIGVCDACFKDTNAKDVQGVRIYARIICKLVW